MIRSFFKYRDRKEKVLLAHFDSYKNAKNMLIIEEVSALYSYVNYCYNSHMENRMIGVFFLRILCQIDLPIYQGQKVESNLSINFLIHCSFFSFYCYIGPNWGAKNDTDTAFYHEGAYDIGHMRFCHSIIKQLFI